MKSKTGRPNRTFDKSGGESGSGGIRFPRKADPLLYAAIRGSADDHTFQLPAFNADFHCRFDKDLAPPGHAPASQRELETTISRFGAAVGAVRADVDAHMHQRLPVILSNAHPSRLAGLEI